MRGLGCFAAILIAMPGLALAHGGGLNAQGCHNDRKGGTGYHCHRAPGRSSAASGRSRPLGLAAVSGESFRNCSAARAAGAAPVRAGDAGYGRHLDRDGDGIGCE
ncbi:MAG: excalibur calcium-binding domain-containing protein [Pseudomonadota bacterium]